ncbi:MAG: glycoside hydrolase family 3 C-terminal domain-containing protein [Ruminococcus sp.]|nr:glycoside hydrolase family 3 C-terminal domain-containing protein [Ruminococcus sp.]
MDNYKFTTDEQISLVNGANFFGTTAIPEKNISPLQLLDGGTGINFEQLFGDFLSKSGIDGIGGDSLRDVLKNFYSPEKLESEDAKKLYSWIYDKLKEIIPDMTAPSCFPSGIFLGSTWNPDGVYEVGQALGDEARAFGINILLGTPNVNIHRDIRNGRLFEGYSEDPFLAASLAPELVKGVQSKDVAANVKHFAANHQETNRMNINEFIPERALQEIYYPGFRACVEAGVETVMSAYNQINGIPCTENENLLTHILREEWGFKGVVMSDWGAVYNPERAVNAGNDLAMPGPIPPDKLREAFDNGTLSPQALETSAERVAALARKFSKPPTGIINAEKSDKIAYETAAEGIILLTNQNKALPLDKKSNIALFGEHSQYLLTCGEGSAGILTDRNIPLTEALESRFNSVSHNEFTEKTGVMVYVYSLHGQEGRDRYTISIPEKEREIIDNLLDSTDERGIKKVLILNVSGPVSLDGYENRFDGILCTFLPGMQGTNAIADCLCGNINPSGKLPLTWPKRIEDTPTYLNFPGDGMQVNYGEGIFVGYRWYDARKITPLFPFGHGLSYTDFEISAISADSHAFTDKVNISVTVKNTGHFSGKTVVQIYVSDVESTLTKPVRELKNYKKIHLEPDEEKTISFTLDRHSFESYDPDLSQWTFEEGYYKISAGLSSRDIQAECCVYADVESPYSYGGNTSVRIIMENPQLSAILKDFFAEYNLPWSAVLTSFEYTAQDKISMILNQVNCSAENAAELYRRFKDVKKK